MVEEIQQNSTPPPPPEDTPATKARKSAMLKALEKSMGVVSEAAKKAKIDRTTHYEWLKTDPEYKKQAESMDNFALDMSESKMFELINGVKVAVKSKNGKTEKAYSVLPNAQLIKFHLSTKGKKRGYVERLQLEDLGGDSEDDEMDTTLKV